MCSVCVLGLIDVQHSSICSDQTSGGFGFRLLSVETHIWQLYIKLFTGKTCKSLMFFFILSHTNYSNVEIQIPLQWFQLVSKYLSFSLALLLSSRWRWASSLDSGVNGHGFSQNSLSLSSMSVWALELNSGFWCVQFWFSESSLCEIITVVKSHQRKKNKGQVQSR